MKDTKSKSLSEAFTNSFGGYPISYGLNILVLPLSVDWIKEDPFVATLFIGIIFAMTSVVRGYCFRRFFGKLGYDDSFVRLAIKLVRRIK